MSSIRTVDGKNYAYIKWSCKDVVDHCSLYFDGVTVRAMTASDRETILKPYNSMKDDVDGVIAPTKIVDPVILAQIMKQATN